jgi:ABC-type transport system substrate-binding protein
MSIALQGNFAKVGITAEIEVVDEAKWVEYSHGTWNNAFLVGAISAGYSNWLQMLAGSFSSEYVNAKSTIRSQTYINLFEEAGAAVEYDPAKVRALVRQMYDEVMAIPICDTSEGWAYQNYLHDAWTPWPAGLQRWSPENAWLSK